MTVKESFQLMSAARVRRALTRIARQILEDTRGEGNIILFGIDERGEKLAAILSSELQKILDHRIPYFQLPVEQKDRRTSEYNADTTGSNIIIIDDVMFSGKTMYRAFKMVMKLGDPKRVKLAVMVDRGHRIYPIEAQYIGIKSPTKMNEHVSCTFDNGVPDAVWLTVE
ncbi:MAG: phosphoribosyltransferase family protein [Balneolales bacterium]